MEWSDSDFDSGQSPFEAGGGLIGRLTSLLQTQGQYLPTDVFPPYAPPSGGAGNAPSPAGPTARGAAAPNSVQQPPDYGQTQNIRVGDYWMPQFGRPQPAAQAAPADFGDRLSAGFQSWAHTPVGNPFAALANGIAGYNAGQFVADPSMSRSSAQQSATGGSGAPVAYPQAGSTFLPRSAVRRKPLWPNYPYRSF